MASIQKRGKKYAVVYTYTDSADVKRQKWETYGTKKEAAARKAQVENEMNNGTFIPPSSVTVRDFLADFVTVSLFACLQDGNMIIILSFQYFFFFCQ